LESHLGNLLHCKGLESTVDVYPIYIELEAEQEGKYKPYKDILYDTALSVAERLHISITDYEARQFAESVPDWRPFDDTVDCLKKLGERGYKRVILSNVDRDLLMKTIARNDLSVDGYITAEDVGSYKPSFGHWNRFFEKYMVAKSSTLHVAQSVYHDLIPANNMGLATAWINRYRDATPRAVKPMFVFPTMSGLVGALD
jgi:2-haloalkanoic acid dehalogenase type II